MRRPVPVVAALAALALLAGCGEATRGGLGPQSDPAAVLREEGVVLLMRHAITEPQTDRPETVGDCATQRNLTDEGREQARAIGAALREADVPLGDVRTSPLCRTLETAQLAFGRATTDRRLLNLSTDVSPGSEARRIAGLQRLLRESPGGTVLVTHTANIGEATGGVSAGEGEILAMRDGELVGRVPPEDLLGEGG